MNKTKRVLIIADGLPQSALRALGLTGGRVVMAANSHLPISPVIIRDTIRVAGKEYEKIRGEHLDKDILKQVELIMNKKSNLSRYFRDMHLKLFFKYYKEVTTQEAVPE